MFRWLEVGLVGCIILRCSVRLLDSISFHYLYIWKYSTSSFVLFREKSHSDLQSFNSRLLPTRSPSSSVVQPAEVYPQPSIQDAPVFLPESLHRPLFPILNKTREFFPVHDAEHTKQ